MFLIQKQALKFTTLSSCKVYRYLRKINLLDDKNTYG